jgi:hypothetical protein
MLVSGDPALNAAARRMLQLRRGPQRLNEMVSAFIRFSGDADALRTTLALYGAALHTVVGNLATAEIPVQTLEQVASLTSVLEIEESRPVTPTLDVSVPATGANQIWYSGGPVAYNAARPGPMPPPWSGNTGKNALVGVIDGGLDLNHKDFLDSSGNTRVQWIWDQENPGTLPASPPGYPPLTGNECNAAQINALHQKTDLAVTNIIDGTMTILKSAGGGSFANADSFLKGHNAVVSVAADFDRDGNIDLITGNSDGTLTWVSGNGHYSFVPQTPITVVAAAVQIGALAAGDFNHDGFPDIAATLYATGQVAILLGNGNGTFKAPTLIGTGSEPTSVSIGDLNGDGHNDIVVANYGGGNVTVLLGDGTGNFTAANGSPFPVSTMDPASSTGIYPSYLVLADFNGDGKLDVATADFARTGSGLPADDLSILLGNGDGTFGPPTTYTTGHFGLVIAAGDLNGDGILDLVVQSYSVNVTVFKGNGDGTFAPGVDYPAGDTTGFYTGESTMVLGDFNGDGKLDVANLVRDNTPNGQFYDLVAVYLGNGDGTLGAAVLSPTGSTGNSSSIVAGNFHSVVCTEQDLGGHGTNVTSIAAGNGSAGGPGALQAPYRYIGMAPEAGIIFVKSLFATVDTVNAVAYIENKAAQLGLPVAINLSIATPFGPHDGTSSLDTMLSGLAGPGNIIIAAMGNNQADNLHVADTAVAGAYEGETFNVPANVTDGVIFDLWYAGQDKLGVTVSGPSGFCIPTANVVYPVNNYSVNTAACGTVSVAASAVNAINGDHEVQITLSNGANPIPPGAWAINVIGGGCASGPCTFNGSFDIWATRTCSPQGACIVFNTPQVTTFTTVGSPGSAPNLVSVASYVTKNSFVSWNTVGSPFIDTAAPTVGDLSYFSSLGPLRVCSNAVCQAQPNKPDVAAPGEEIMGAYAAGTPTAVCTSTPGGFCLDPDAQHIAYQGTSQASPHATGAVALMLAKNPTMSPCQVKTSLTHARTDNFTNIVPNPLFGYGKLAVDLAINVAPVSNPAPNVVGQTQAAAKTALVNAGLSVGIVTTDGSATVAAGKIISQTPAAGTPWCGPVNLVISTGLKSIAVTPANPSVLAGLTQQFTATGTYQNNSTADLSNQVTWASSSPAIAGISASGLAGTLSQGTSTISATLGSVSGSTLLTSASPGHCDVTGDGLLTVFDVTAIMSQALGTAPATADLNHDGKVNAADVQIVIQAMQGQGCSAM